jgi:flagellar biosynthesis/type III secretory pathway protein FliH
MLKALVGRRRSKWRRRRRKKEGRKEGKEERKKKGRKEGRKEGKKGVVTEGGSDPRKLVSRRDVFLTPAC